MKKWYAFGTALTLSALLLTGCGTTDSKQEETTTQTTQQATYPLTLKDATNKDVSIKQQPSEIITLSPNITETLFALGLSEQVVGVTANDNYPKEVSDKEQVGDMNPNIEKIISLNPDFVLVDASSLGTIEAGLQQLRDANITVFVVPTANSFEETYENITLIGQVTNKEKEAKAIVKDMKEKVVTIQEKIKEADVPKRSVFVEASDAPDIYTAGKNTYMQEMITLIDATNIAENGGEGWFKMDAESIVKQNPDVIIATYDYVPNIVEKIKKRDGFDSVTAIKENRVVQVDEDTTSRTGPRLADGLEEIAKAVYPEAFK